LIRQRLLRLHRNWLVSIVSHLILLLLLLGSNIHSVIVKISDQLSIREVVNINLLLIGVWIYLSLLHQGLLLFLEQLVF